MAQFFKDLLSICKAYPDLVQAKVARAQRETMVSWRDREDAPGIKSRFGFNGYAFYGFGRRASRYFDRRNSLVPTAAGLAAGVGSQRRAFTFSGALEAMMLARMPKTRVVGDRVITTFAMGGGHLNFLGANARGRNGKAVDMRPVTGIQVINGVAQHLIAARMNPGYKTLRRGTVTFINPYLVPGHVVSYRTKAWQVQRGGRYYVQEFQDLDKDLPWLRAEFERRFKAIMRQVVFTKQGGVRSAYADLVYGDWDKAA